MAKFNQPELNLINTSDKRASYTLDDYFTSHNIYEIKRGRPAWILEKSKKSEKTRSKSIALNVMGKPNKVLFNKNHIISVTNDYGITRLQLINQKEPVILRDSVAEVNNLIWRS